MKHAYHENNRFANFNRAYDALETKQGKPLTPPQRRALGRMIASRCRASYMGLPV